MASGYFRIMATKTADLRVRLEEADLERIKRRASEKHLSTATHVRQVLLEDAQKSDPEGFAKAIEHKPGGGPAR